MNFLGNTLRLVFIGGGVSSVVFPSLIAAGYKDFEGHGKPNRTNNNGSGSTHAQSGKKETSVTLDNSKKKQISDNSSKVGKSYGIDVGKIPGTNKISGKLNSKCTNGSSSGSSSTSITLGSDKGNAGRKNGKTNKNLFGEVQFTCQNKSGTLFLKGEGGKEKQRGGYGRVEMNN